MISEELLTKINKLEENQQIYLYGYLKGFLQYLEKGLDDEVKK